MVKLVVKEEIRETRKSVEEGNASFVFILLKKRESPARGVYLISDPSCVML
jgi:hypothetical protein